MADRFKIAFAECPDLPYLPELPARGAYAGLIGRSNRVPRRLAADLQPAGWRLTMPRAGTTACHQYARVTSTCSKSTLRATGNGQAVRCGPLALAAMMERRAVTEVADPERGDVSQSLAEGIAQSLPNDPQAPDVDRFSADEPMLPAVLVGSIPPRAACGDIAP